MKWRKAGKRWTLSEAGKLGTIGIARMSLQEKAELAQFYYRQFNLRTQSFVKANVMPYAFTKLVQDYEKIRNSDKLSDLQREVSLEQPVVVVRGRSRELNYPFNEMNNPNAALNGYIRRMQSFFAAKSSTVKGWNEVAEQQDKELFGVDVTYKRRYKYEKGPDGKRHRVELAGPFVEVRPKKRLTDAERRELWRIIDLAKDSGWLNAFGYNSSQAHKEISSLWQKGEFGQGDIDEAAAKIDELINKKLNPMYYEDVQPGDRNNPLARREGEGDNGDLLSQYDAVL